MTKYADRVKETTTTTGTDPYILRGAVTGFQSFIHGVGNGSIVTYCAELETQWEIGEGRVTSGSSDVLTRTTIISSSNSNNVIDWTSGVKTIYLTATAERLMTHQKTLVSTNSTMPNQIIAVAELAEIDNAVEFNVRGVSSSGKSTLVTVQAQQVNGDADYCIFGFMTAGQTTGSLSVAFVDNALLLQVTPTSALETTWTTEYRVLG
jgi:hypothetical protein